MDTQARDEHMAKLERMLADQDDLTAQLAKLKASAEVRAAAERQYCAE